MLIFALRPTFRLSGNDEAVARPAPRIVSFPRGSARRYTQVLKARHFGMDAEIQRPRMANCGTQQMPLYPRTGNCGLASHLHSRLVTVHGLDFGIPAEMTAFPDLCITASEGAWGTIKLG